MGVAVIVYTIMALPYKYVEEREKMSIIVTIEMETTTPTVLEQIEVETVVEKADD